MPGTARSARPPLILVADDVASVRLLYATVLMGEGYRVVEARDGVEALERILADKPDLAILDISMPRMDGMQVLEAMRKEDQRTPVVVITAHKERETVLAAAQRGIVSYLTKPIHIGDLRDRVHKTLLEHGIVSPGSRASAGLPDPAAALDAESKAFLASAPKGGWDIEVLDAFLRTGEDLESLVAFLAVADDAAPPHELTRAERIAQMPPDAAVAKLREAFDRGSTQVRAAVLEILPPSIPEERRVALLAEWVATPNPLVAARALDALAALRSPAAYQAMVPLMEDGYEPVLRQRVLDALQGYGWLKAVDLLLDYAASSRREVPEAALECLRALPVSHVLDRIRSVLREGGGEARACAVRLAPRFGGAEARRIAENALGDPEAQVRSAAVEGLARARDRRAVPAVLDLVTDPDPAVLETLCRSAEAFSMKPETGRVIRRASALPPEARTAIPMLLARLESGADGLSAVLQAQLRAGDAERASLVSLAETLGFREALPPGPPGPVVAKAFADHLARLLTRDPAEAPR